MAFHCGHPNWREPCSCHLHRAENCALHRHTKAFLLLLMSSEAHSCLSACQYGQWKQFQTVRSSCEARTGQFGCQERCRAQFSALWSSIRQFSPTSEGLVKLWNGIFGTRKDLESSLDHYGCPVKLVHTSIGARKGIERNFSTSEVQLSSYMFVCV